MNLPKEPSHTCPDIDRAIKNLQSDVNSYFEDVRSANISLRAWGHNLVSIIEDLENEKSALQDEIEKLNEKIQELEGALV